MASLVNSASICGRERMQIKTKTLLKAEWVCGNDTFLVIIVIISWEYLYSKNCMFVSNLTQLNTNYDTLLEIRQELSL